jgi:hypothetical protein
MKTDPFGTLLGGSTDVVIWGVDKFKADPMKVTQDVAVSLATAYVGG